MIPRWYRSRLFWLGLLGLALLVGAWVRSFAGGVGHSQSWSSGGGWMGVGTWSVVAPGRLVPIRVTSGSRMSPWDLKRQKKVRFPWVQAGFAPGGGKLLVHYGFWVAAWSVAWLVMLGSRYLPRRVRPPRFPGSPRRWFASPFLWVGVRGCVVLLALWIDSAGYRSYASWRWTRAQKPDYLGFGEEANQGKVRAWAGRAYEGFFSRSRETGFNGFRRKSLGSLSQPEASAMRGKWRSQSSYLALSGLYVVIWSGLAGGWQFRQARLRRGSLAVVPAA